MGTNASTHGRNRALIAQEAARIIAHEGVKDFRLAKRKAAERLGFRANGDMPRNSEVQEALKAYQRLFGGEDQVRQLNSLRATAAEAMRFFARFRPRLVGSVLAGTAGQHTPVELHLFADTPEEVMLFLLEQGIPYESNERRFRLSSEEYAWYPVYVFAADQVGIELGVFPTAGLRRAPLSPVDGKPMQRADLAQLERLNCGTTMPT
jgi:hypothetical protein